MPTLFGLTASKLPAVGVAAQYARVSFAAPILAWALCACTASSATSTSTPSSAHAATPATPICALDAGPPLAASSDGIGVFDGSSELRAWVAMWNRYDLDRVDALFVRDARVTYFSSERPGLISGIDALKAHHRGFGFVPGGADKGSRLWLEAVSARPLGRVVVVTATWFFERPAAKKPPQRGPVTLILTNEGEGCRILHAHFANDPPDKAARPSE